MEIKFTKMHGCGNDFILIDHREQFLQGENITKLVRTICRSHFHIGANGVILLENSKEADFRMRYFNADGSEGEMCGNGARCVAKFAYQNGVVTENMTFETLDGMYVANILEDGQVQVKFPDLLATEMVTDIISENMTLYSLHVGVPHTVYYAENIKQFVGERYLQTMRKIRYNQALFPAGTNVNIVEVIDEHQLVIRTYERGVEEETFACGSGATAAAVISSVLNKTSSPVHVETKGGILTVQFLRFGKQFRHLTLTGNAITVFQGKFSYDA